MKNILFTLFAILILTSCSKDDDNWIELNENNIVGNWSTGIKGSHKFLNFGDDDKGSFGIYSNADPISFQTFKYKGLSLKPWGIALKFLFLHHENILFPND
ncbi:membrane lipoprotein lipid attachment site-containing protein, partial [Bacteroides xylanisolvens]|uniref:membrane lipoprotein lipid attachment site-containing protein n=1 Tax=Bacteroides xylanisolvens TaxID=371601 RepID=UPI001CDBBC2C